MGESQLAKKCRKKPKGAITPLGLYYFPLKRRQDKAITVLHCKFHGYNCFPDQVFPFSSLPFPLHAYSDSSPYYILQVD